VNRRFLAWFLSLPVILAGVEGGHWLAYRLAYPDPYLRAQELAATGHGYFSYAPLFFAVGGAVALCAFWLRVLGREPRRPGGTVTVRAQVSLLPFLVAAPLTFALQECIERLFAGGWPFVAVFAPTFLPGLVFQLPFALVAFVIARLLLRAADRLRSLVFRPVASRLAAAIPVVSAARLDLPRLAVLAFGVAERGPPPRRLGPAPAVCRG
jgi:hypothetical protein